MGSNGLKMIYKNHTIVLIMEKLLSWSKIFSFFINSWLEMVTGVAPLCVHPHISMCQPKWLVTHVHLVKLVTDHFVLNKTSRDVTNGSGPNLVLRHNIHLMSNRCIYR